MSTASGLHDGRRQRPALARTVFFLFLQVNGRLGQQAAAGYARSPENGAQQVYVDRRYCFALALSGQSISVLNVLQNEVCISTIYVCARNLHLLTCPVTIITQAVVTSSNINHVSHSRHVMHVDHHPGHH